MDANILLIVLGMLASWLCMSQAGRYFREIRRRSPIQAYCIYIFVVGYLVFAAAEWIGKPVVVYVSAMQQWVNLSLGALGAIAGVVFYTAYHAVRRINRGRKRYFRRGS